MFSFNISGGFAMPGTAIIGGEPPVDLELYPHFQGAPLPYLGCFTTEDGANGMIFLDDAVDESWAPEDSANAVLIEGQEVPSWIQLKECDNPPVVIPDEVELEFDGGEPKWLQGDETPEGSTFLFEIPSNISPDLNIGDGYGTAYVFNGSDGVARLLWQS